MEMVYHRTSDQLSRALGEAVVKVWGNLPHYLQNRLFKEATAFLGEEIRPQLAIFLHRNHPRTCAALRARATPEPDSLGG
jgi:hypothetical protein